MQPLRAYLLVFSDLDCHSSVHRDLKSLRDAWEVYFGRKDVTGFIHVGFSRPETESFMDCSSNFQGRMLLSASARWALESFCKCVPNAVGEVESIPIFLAVNGWGYDLSTEEIGLVNSSTDPIEVEEIITEIDPILLCSVDYLNLPVRAANCLKEKGIFRICDLIQYSESDLYKLPNFGKKSLNDINSALSSINLPPINLYNNSVNNFPISEGNVIKDPLTSLILSSPSWMLAVSIDSLGLQVRTFNALDLNGFKIVGDMANFSSKMLLEIPNFGITSLRDLDLRLRLALEVGPALTSSNQAYVDEENNLNNNTIRLGSAFKNLNSLAEIIVAAVSSLPPNREKAVRARMGLGCESMTLEEIGNDMDVTRQMVQQYEAKGLAQIGQDTIWKDGLAARLTKLIDERDDPLPFSGLPILDAWFFGIEDMEEPFKYILEHKNIIDREFSILKVNSQLFVSRLSQNEWNSILKQAMQLLEDGVNQAWSLSDARRRVEDLLGKKGRELCSELWVAAKQFANFSSLYADNEPVLISYGRGAEALVEAVLFESERPLHYSEIPQHILERYGKDVDVRRANSAAAQVALLYGKGFYGLLKHSPLNYQERQIVCNEVLEIIFHGTNDRQWSCSELVDMLNESGLNFDGRLNAYSLNIALRDSTEISYLGRNVWVQSNSTARRTANRIDIRQAVTTLLMQSGKPMSNSEIKEILRNDRGIGDTFQIFPSGSIINVGVGLWGLIERDLPLNTDEQLQLCEILQDILRDRNNGIHISEIFSCLEGVFEPVLRLNDPVQIFAVALRSELMRKSYGDYLFLSEWGNPRRLNSSEAVIEVLKQADSSGLKATEIINLASIILGRPVRRDCIHSSLYDAGAKFNVTTKRWTLPDANEVEEAIQFNAE